MTRARAIDRHQERFAAFLAHREPTLRRALVAAYGPADGRQAAVDALAWAWEHWERVEAMEHPMAYLYRVGQSAARRYRPRDVPAFVVAPVAPGEPDPVPELMPALAELSEAQRVAVVLVHGYGYTEREAADVLGIAPSTVHVNLERALARLRQILEVSDG